MIELSVENLHLTYGDNPVLKGVSMTLQRGEVVSLLGPSGSGKTTLLRAVAGLEKPTAGRITIGKTAVYDGNPRSEIPAEERNLGLVFQSYALWPHKTVFENVAYPLKLRKVASGEIAQRVQAVLDQLGLGNLGSRHPHQLSGGQQQRVAIGRALVYNPPVILLDEPLSNLDAKLREEARVFLRELIIKLGLSALMVTHDQNEAMAISDRILLLNNGVIEQQGTPQEMYGNPTTLFAAEFMGSNNRLRGKITALENGRARIEGASWALWGMAGEGVSVGQQATAVIRVERLRLGSSPEDNMLELPLLTSMYLGDRWEYLFRTRGDDFAIRAYGSALRDAEHCHITLPADDLWIFPTPQVTA
ncbi:MULTISPECIES: ABC transporter ATP-binding protein [Raoultella]|uniref:ABC transporter ATP-binding protein n=1 Tax=Raoultella TaxID=160674 RepID=UPI002166D0A8|nr:MULTISPECIES: ABC transporter ATP-binding protein [Raoultella]MCS4271078.1 iron(III) transport system ATP-binding protein [Raoultella sp. BIGb0132]MCS4288613.1 iron(III) transport system ATP-binding protein [Raoultella terrigena]